MLNRILNKLADIIVKRITPAIEALQGARADLEALACDRKCGKRRTPNQHCKNQLRYVGCEAYKGELYTSKEPSTDNQRAEEELPPMCARCHEDKGSCNLYDETLTYCGDFYPPQNAADEEAVNVEAVKSAKSPHYESTKEALKESIE